MRRDRVHQVAYLRNSIAHSPQPSLAEGVAGVAAMAEVLKDHGEDAAAAEMEVLLDRVRCASWLGAGVDELLLLIEGLHDGEDCRVHNEHRAECRELRGAGVGAIDG